MAIRMFCTTFFTALATCTAAPALAFDLAATNDAVQHRPADIISFEPGAFAGPAAPVIASTGDAPLEPFTHAGLPELTAQPYSQEPPAAEPGSLPLLGAAAIALFLAQLRRSRHPMP